MTTEASLLLLDDRFSTPFRVVALVGEEAINELFWFRLAFVVPIPAGHEGDPAEADQLARDILGARGRFTITFRSNDDARPPVSQTRWGVIASVHGVSAVNTGDPRFFRIDVTIVPRAYRLALRKRSRVFQHRFVHQVVSEVLFEHGLVHRWDLAGTYARRQYCVQYRETDLAFVKRLLAEEGLAFFFEHRNLPLPAAPVPEVPQGDTVESVLGAVVGIHGAVTAVGGLVGSPVVRMIGGVGSLAADALRGPERDPDAIQELPSAQPGLRTGSAGPYDHGDVFCFVDAAAAYVRVYPADAPRQGSGGTVGLVQQDQNNLRRDGLDAFDFVSTRRVASQRVVLRDHDFRRPMLEMRSEATRSMTDAGDPPAGHGPPLDTKPSPTSEVYEHHGDYDPHYLHEDDAATRLEQLQADVRTAGGRTLCPRIMPGHLFDLTTSAPPTMGAPAPRAPLFADGSYAAIRVRHQWLASAEGLGWDALAYRFGRTPDDAGDPPGGTAITRFSAGLVNDYLNEVECVPSAAMHRPKPSRRPLAATCETAIVVGPPGAEIHTDKFGRVRVQFHWDREGAWNDKSSPYLRVAQPWAGAGFGFQFLPRVGMEVLVSFVGGDPDRPVITGCLYDGTHPTPEPLPERATRSAIRTQTSPGGGGFNEIAFEDARDNERLTIRAESALEEAAKGSHAVTVGKDQRVLVGATQQIGVSEDQIVAVGGRQTSQVGGDRSDNVGGSVSSVVQRHVNERVDGSAVRTVGGADVAVTAHDEMRVVGGSRAVTVRGNDVTHVGGNEGEGNAVAFVRGDAYLTTEGSVVVRGLGTGDSNASKIRLGVGNSEIEIGPHAIYLSSETVAITASTRVIIAGHGHRVVLDDSGGLVDGSPLTLRNSDGSRVHIDGGITTVVGTSAVRVRGSQISLQGGQGSSTSSSTQSNQQTPQDNVILELTHGRMRRLNRPTDEENDQPTARDFHINKLSGVPCRITYQGSLIADRTVGGDGVLRFHVPDAVHEVEVTLLIDQVEDPTRRDLLTLLYPDAPLTFLVKLVDAFPAADSAEGKRLRLRNLGFETGLEPRTGNSLDDSTSDAFERFGEEQGLSNRQSVESATVARLRTLYGDS
jgi:type VI secretion system secreted protein VgrG